jgi:tRNA(Ile)-lysidine synthase
MAKAYENFLDDYIQPKIKEIMTEDNRNVSWDIEKLKLEKPVVQQKILRRGIEKLKTDLKEIQYHHILECIRRINEEKNTTWDYHLPGDYMIIRRYQRLIITGKKYMSEEKSVLYPLLPEKEYYMPYLRLCVKCYEANISEMPAELEGMWDTACFDLDKVTLPLMIRNRRTGDAYSPKGFAGRKKIKKEMINRKIPKEERCHIPILCDSKGLIWMIPSGKDEKYLISNRTGRILVIKYKYYG